MTFDCSGHSECENSAQCLQDDQECPRRSMCICPPCFYGSRCQFSTNGFGLSLDAILGYHILTDVSLSHQPFITKVSLALTIIFMVAGLIDGFLCMITFKNKTVRDVGCGLYLLGSSITPLVTMNIFGLKFLILLLAQMTIISNRSFLLFQCHSIDFVLRVCLNMNQWLNACVASERAITVMKSTRFVKKKSKQAAKLVIIILLIVIIGTCIHDPTFRHLIDENNDNDEDHSYIHFILLRSGQQLHTHKDRSYKEILQQQIQQHKNLLTTPIVLIILALPRLILIFISKCMNSIDDSWLFLIGYFISFIPCMLTFIVFILPSEFYKTEFQNAAQQYRSIIQQRLHFT